MLWLKNYFPWLWFTIMFGDNDTVVNGSCFADRLRNWLNAMAKAQVILMYRRVEQ